MKHCRSFATVYLYAQRFIVQPAVFEVHEVSLIEAGKEKGPEGPLLFACLLRQGEHWKLLNFSLWAPQEVNSV